MIRFLIEYGPTLKLSNFKKLVPELIKIVITVAIATISSLIAGKVVSKLTKKTFSTNQIKNYFKNTKYLKSAFGIGTSGKTARRMWFVDYRITTILSNFINGLI